MMSADELRSLERLCEIVVEIVTDEEADQIIQEWARYRAMKEAARGFDARLRTLPRDFFERS